MTVIVLASTLTNPADAAKCRNGKGILYTQEQHCPSGYTDITASMGGNVSTYSAPTPTTHTSRVATVDATRTVPSSPARCQRLQVDRNMLGDQLRRTGWKLEQDNVRAQLMQIEEEMAARGC
ncbi:hypothetical protein ACIP1U_11190 [Cupriavidus sp. NPDC089707]|uniref:hypothetical protein n=1 Tax=Cupriavidus sp. NPDC089707 TaxID=3363963 RepID=UPI0038246AF0